MNPLLVPLSCLLVAGLLRGQQETAGPLQLEEIFQKCPDWQAVAAAYSPSPEAVERLRAVPREVVIEVFLGAWCSDSKSHVSELLKVLQVVDNPLIRATFVAVPEDKGRRAPYLAGKDILKIPTFIVLIDGVEKGRIVETPVKTVEDDLADLLSR